jgi:hypothetical protein
MNLSLDTWLGLVGLTVGLLGLITGYIFYRKGKRERAPRYALRSKTIVTDIDNIPGLTVHYTGHGKPIANFTITHIVFWNAGNDTIKKQDVVKSDPVAVTAREGFTILAADVVQFNNPANNFAITSNREKTRATLTFDYVDLNEGVLLQVFHSGSKGDEVRLTGKIMGAGPPREAKLSAAPAALRALVEP